MPKHPPDLGALLRERLGEEAWKELERRERMEDPKKLADEHWDYVKAMLEVEMREDDFISSRELYLEAAGFHYKTAMIHGYKHGYEAAKKEGADGST